MRIALVVYGGLEILTGGYLYDRLLVEHLRRGGHRVEVVSLPAAGYASRLADNLSPRIAAKLGRVSCDVMIEDALVHPSMWLLNRHLGRRWSFPRIALAHMVLSSQPRRAWQNRCYRIFEEAFYRSVDGCIANSRTTLTHLAGWGVTGRPFVVAPPGGDRLGHIASEGRITKRAMAPGPLRLLFLGNVLPGKGLLPLLAALFRIPDVEWRLTVAGSLTMARDHIREVQAAIGRSSLGNRVRLAGPMRDRALVNLLETSHVTAMPFAHEGFGMAIVEGMAYGLPALASAGGAARETVIAGVSGFLVPEHRPETVCRAVRRLAGDRALLARMGIQARRRFFRHPTWPETLKKIESFLLQMVG